MAIFGCNTAELAPIEPEIHSIQAIMEGEDTKTSVSDAGYFTWAEGDKIWLQTTNGGVEGTLSSGAGTSNATFSYGAHLGSMTGKAVYPFGDHAISETTLTVSLPASYDLGTCTDNTNAAMYAVVSEGTLKFTHMAGLMRFEFKEAPVGTNQFKITVDKKINGKFTADLTEDYPTLTVGEASTDEEKTITINFIPLEEAKDLRIFVPLPIGTYESLALELNAGENNVWKYSKEITNTINRKSLLLMPTISMGGSIGGDIENDGSIDGDIDNGEYGDHYIKFEDGSTYTDLGVFTAEGTGSSTKIVKLDTNVETGFQLEYPEGIVWATGHVYNNSNLYVTIYKNKGFARSSTMKVRAKDDPNVYAEIKFAQESAIAETMTYDHCECYTGEEGKVIATSDNTLDFIVTSGTNNSQGFELYGLCFNTNISDYIMTVPEDSKSWIGGGIEVGYDTIVLEISPNESLERSSSVELKCPHTGKVFYTINIIQQTNPAAFVDLSANGTANCYIVSETGAYKFPANKGNTTESVAPNGGYVSSVEVLWEAKRTGAGASTIGSLIKSVSRNHDYDVNRDYIEFITPEVFEEGNAVIAAKDKDGKILWSWHIWLTDVPKEHAYGSYGFMMDRNLGALTSEVAEYNTAGLLYQWGRKDPFLGAKSMRDNWAKQQESSATWPSPVESSSTTGTIEYATENPMTFITYNANNSDWQYSTDTSSDFTRWASNKTEYDPCPAGWRVPDGGPDGIWAKSKYPYNGSWFYSYHTQGKYIDDKQTGYPAAPYLIGYTGEIYDPEEAAGWWGHYWSCTTTETGYGYTDPYVLQFFYPGNVHDKISSRDKAAGYSVRCQKEQ